VVRWVLVCGDAAQCDGWMTPEKLAAVRGRSQQLTQRINHPEDRIGTAVGESPVTALIAAEDIRAAWEAMPLCDREQVVDRLMT
jgi:hypothetical protein